MLTDFRNRLTYFGTLDDVVYRYPWPAPLDKTSIQQQLITAAIYDKKILINDGYLVANPQLLGDLQDIDRSLVGNLMMTGAARLFAAGGKADLAGGIENRAATINTHRRLIADKARWRTTRDDLVFLSGQVEKYTVPWPADKNMGEIFYRLMQQVRGLDGNARKSLMTSDQIKDFDGVFKCFDEAVDKPSYESARTVWESQCWIYFQGKEVEPSELTNLATVEKRQAHLKDYDRVRPMMNIACEIYHLAYSMAALHSLKTGTSVADVELDTVGVATGLLTALPDFLGPETPVSGQSTSDEAEQQERMIELNQILIAIPPGLTFMDDFYFVTRLTTNGDCRRARALYLAMLKDFVEGRGDVDTARRIRDDYARELRQQLKLGVKRNVIEYGVDRLFDLIGIPLDMLTHGALLTLGNIFLLSIGLDWSRNRLVERLVERRIDVALGNRGREATQNAGAVPLARELGLYLGPIKPEGSEHLLEDIKPYPVSPKPAAQP
jgi:hypothetical protein